MKTSFVSPLGLTMIVSLSVILVGCSSPTPIPTVEPSATPQPTATATSLPPTDTPPQPAATSTATRAPTATSLPAGMLFIDDFKSKQVSAKNGWSTSSDNSSSYEWSASGLLLSVSEPDSMAWNILSKFYADLAIEIEARPLSQDYIEYGIVFREDHTTASNFYAFGVNTNGQYFLWKYVKDQYADAWPVSLTTSSQLKRGSGLTKLGIIAEGSTIRLYINGSLVTQINDDALNRGNVGVFVSSHNSINNKVAFSRFVIYTIQKAKADWGTTLAAGSSLGSTPQATAGPKATAVPKAPPLVTTLFQTRHYIEDIGGAMDRLYHGGGAEACAPLLADYNGVVNGPVYNMSGQPQATQSAYDKYRQAIAIIADRIRPIQRVCSGGGGTVGKLDFDTGRTAINDAGSLIGDALQLMGQ